MMGIDRKDWKRATLGEVCRNLNITERDPLAAGIERYVGLEHIEPENLHIKSWGAIADGTTFTKMFEPGQVLFGKRRAYQKKAAIADFAGICSGDILVLEAIESVINPRLLPFVVNADRFFEHAVQTSAGSLSPRTKFQDLAKYSFLLPPKEEQARLAELLWAGDEVVEHYENMLNSLLRVKFSYRSQELFEIGDIAQIAANIKSTKVNLPANWKLEVLSDVACIKDNLRKPINKEVRQTMAGDFPYYGPTGVLDSINEYRVEGEHVLIGEDGDHFNKYNDWDMTILADGKYNVNNHAHIVAGTPICLTKWIYYFYQHRNILQLLKKQGATRLKLTKETLMTLPIVLPPIQEQTRLIGIFDSIEMTIESIRNCIQTSKQCLQNMVNSCFQ